MPADEPATSAKTNDDAASASVKDLRHFLHALQLQRPDDIVHVRPSVSPDREPVALLQRLEAEDRSPLLWFDRVGDAEFPVLTNVHGTPQRLALAMGVPVQRVHEAYMQRLDDPIEPIHVETGPVQECTIGPEAMDLGCLPLIRPSDNATAPYLGGGILLAKDPETGIANLSYNRLMLQSRNRFGFHAAPGLHLARICQNAERLGEALPVAIIIGHHPAFSLGTLAKVPFEVDEYWCAGAMLQQPVPLVRCKTLPLDVPAYAEVILEGHVLPGVRDIEGPYDEFTGYAMPAETQPVIEITCITYRRDAIWQDVFGGGNEHKLMGALPKEASQLAQLRQRFPFVNDFHMPPSGGARLHGVIALGPHAAGQAKQALEAALAFDHFLKHVVAVDDDIDIRDERQVSWAMATRFQGDADLIVQSGQLGSSLDPSTPPSGKVAKLGFDCTRKRSDFPEANRIDPAVLQRMNPDKYLD